MDKPDDCRTMDCMQYTSTVGTIISCIILIVAMCYTTYNWNFFRTLIVDLRSLVDTVNIIIPGIQGTVAELKTMCKYNMTEQYNKILEQAQMAQRVARI